MTNNTVKPTPRNIKRSNENVEAVLSRYTAWSVISVDTKAKVWLEHTRLLDVRDEPKYVSAMPIFYARKDAIAHKEKLELTLKTTLENTAYRIVKVGVAIQ